MTAGQHSSKACNIVRRNLIKTPPSPLKAQLDAPRLMVNQLVFTSPLIAAKTAVSPLEYETNPIRWLGYLATMLFLFVRFTALHEVLVAKLGFNTYLLYILAPPAFIAIFLTGGLRRCLRERPVRYWIGFLVCLIVAIPFSSWRAGSMELVFTYMRTEIISLFMIAGLVLAWREVWAVLQVLAVATAVTLSLSEFFRGNSTDRLELSAGTMSNSNDYGAQLTMMLPFLVLTVITPGRWFVFRLAAAGGVMYGIYVILSTGSRGALVALAFSFIYALFRVPARFKIVVAAVLLVGMFGVFAVLRSETINRLSTLFYRSDAPVVEEAAGSAESRMYLLEKSLWFTITHPLWGIGPGQFADYEGGAAKKQGMRGNWHETHNAYTQVSSEAGIPALIFMLAAIGSTLRILNRTYSRRRTAPMTLQQRRIVLAAFCVTLSVVSFCSAIFFLSLAYRFYLPALTGIAIALTRAAEHEESLLPTTPNA